MDKHRFQVYDLDQLAAHLYSSRNNIDSIISEFGAVSFSNGYGTLFLKSSGLFSQFWIHCGNDKVQSVGFGGPELAIPMSALLGFFDGLREGFVPYDGEYVYVFYPLASYDYTIKVSSREQILIDKEVVNDLLFTSFEILFRSESDSSES